MALMAARWYGDPSRELRVVGVTGTNGKTTTAHLVAGIFAAAGLPGGTARHRRQPHRRRGPRRSSSPPPSRSTCSACSPRWSPRATRRARSRSARTPSPRTAPPASTSTRSSSPTSRATTSTTTRTSRTTSPPSAGSSCPTRRATARPWRSSTSATSSGARLAARVPAALRRRPVDLRGRRRGAGPAAPTVASPATSTCAPTRSAFTLVCPRLGLEERVTLRLAARFNVENALAAAAAGLALGLPAEAVLRGLAVTEGVPGRFEAVRAGQPFSVRRRLLAHARLARERAARRARRDRRPRDRRVRLRRRPRPRQAPAHGRHRRPAGRPRRGHVRQPAQRGAAGDHRRDRRRRARRARRAAVVVEPDRRAAIRIALDRGPRRGHRRHRRQGARAGPDRSATTASPSTTARWPRKSSRELARGVVSRCCR